ncbi:hypothetical protein ACS0TY_006663 [Phlomoides rotata]
MGFSHAQASVDNFNETEFSMNQICEIGFCSESQERLENMKIGGLRNIPQNNGEIESIGRFAVQQHNNNQICFPSISLISAIF